MKVATLSLPLNWNCGGILQQFALQEALKRQGHEITVLSRRKNREDFWSRMLVDTKWRLLDTAGQVNLLRFHPLVAVERFKQRYLPTLLPSIYDDASMRRLAEHGGFEAFVVGSDQIWNATAAPHLEDSFLGFTQGIEPLRRVAYAASFGREEWRYTPEQQRRCAELAHRFDAVSVRESSGVRLCREYFDLEATHVPDPTLLLEAEVYREIASTLKAQPLSGTVFAYILDVTEDRRAIVEQACKATGYAPAYFFADSWKTALRRASEGFYPSVEQWLAGFSQAEFVVTDSFHGTLFAILFNRPFISIANSERGLARFQSLLGALELEHRLVLDGKELPTSFIQEEIDWTRINAKLKSMRRTGLEFLRNNVK